MSYSVNDDYCNYAKHWQLVSTEEGAMVYLNSKGYDSSDTSVKAFREGTK